MRVLLLISFVVFFSAVAFAWEEFPVIPHEYVIQFKHDTPLAIRKLHLTNLTSHPSWSLSEHNKIMHQYEIASFSGYAARIHSNDLLSLITVHPSVLRVEPNIVVKKTQAQCSEQTLLETGLWGKARITSPSIPPPGSPYKYPSSAGEGVDAYVIDTGIYIDHDEFFPNRAIAPADGNFIPGEANTDLNGHGTHCAGTVGGNSFGIATKSTLIAVKVLNSGGSGTLAGVIAGCNWVAARRKETQNPSTANLSLGASFSQAVNDACDALVDAGVTVVVAAGNSNRVTCGFSPASAKKVISVAASDSSDIRAWFSNFGNCTDLFAPGVNILSSYIGSRGARNTLSGTSMAAPHVAGVATVYLGLKPSTEPADVKHWINNHATPGQITDAQGTPNRLLFQGCYTA